MTMSLPAYRHLLVFFSLVAKANNKSRSRFIIVLGCFSLVKDDNEPRSWLVIVFGCFVLVAEDDDKPLSLLSFSTKKILGAKNDNELGVSSSCLGFFP